LQLRKRVFWEAQGAADCDALLRAYCAHVRSSRAAGALLLCVVGAKLSEGINFGDELGRCVVVLGLPYGDLRDLEMQERLAFAEAAGGGGGGGGALRAVPQRGGKPAALGPVAREMYTNLCMQAVNQCVGRAIRHARDFAAIVLLDCRYTGAEGSGVKSKLPSWLTRTWVSCPAAFEPVERALRRFYQTCQGLG